MQLPSLNFTLFGFPVAIGLDFLLIAFFLGAGAGSFGLVVAWVVVVACSILVHELGHAFALRRYGIHPQIRLWGMGGLTLFGFALPPRKSLVVSLAGPFFGIPIGLLAMVVLPRLDQASDLAAIVFMIQWVNLGWGLLNLLPIASLDGGNVVMSGFAAILGPRGRTPGLLVVALGSVLVAVGAIAIGFPYLALVIVIFGFINPTPYLEAWRLVTGGLSPSRSRGTVRPAPSRLTQTSGQSATAGGAGSVGPRRTFGEAYAETLGDRAGMVDLDDMETRPLPLIADVTGMVARGDDAGVAARLASETDPLTVLTIVARIVDGKRLSATLKTLRRGNGQAVDGLLKLQVGLFAMGRFEDSIGAAGALAADGNAASALLVARCAARMGDRKLLRQGLERAVALGHVSLSDAALGDIARVGPDERVAELLTRLRATQTA
jgi:Zn-dependent protease